MDYIPAEDEACLTYLLTLSGCLSTDYAAYGVSSADAANLASKVADYQAKLLLARGGKTRTPVMVQEKDQTKAIAIELARTFVRLIKPNDGISDSLKTAAGIPLPRKGGYEPIGRPLTAPALTVVGSTYQSHTISYRDSVEQEKRRKPYGVGSLHLLMAIADEAVSDSSQAQLVDVYTRGPIGIAFEPSQNKKVATYWAAWANPRQQRGPLSVPVSMTIAA